ncbi:MAG: alpha/beta hydrolase, partial [Actinobacteria bacterium]|nr:alpha/beta hydrolase [Actinomycetota bacterium]
PSRAAELDAVSLPTLVVQGSSDRFGTPQSSPTREVAVVSGDHRLIGDLAAVADAVAAWLEVVV